MSKHAFYTGICQNAYFISQYIWGGINLILKLHFEEKFSDTLILEYPTEA